MNNNKSGKFDNRISLFDLPLDDIIEILESVYCSTSAEDAALTIDQKLKRSSSTYRNGHYQIVIEDLTDN